MFPDFFGDWKNVPRFTLPGLMIPNGLRAGLEPPPVFPSNAVA